MTPDQVRDEVLTLMSTGYETIGDGLTWCWYLLSQHLSVESRMVEEIENVLIRLNKEFNLTIIIVEQNVNFIKKATNNFSILERGKIVEEGDSSKITQNFKKEKL